MFCKYSVLVYFIYLLQISKEYIIYSNLLGIVLLDITLVRYFIYIYSLRYVFTVL